jgi:Tfp pilus assembly protein PilO
MFDPELFVPLVFILAAFGVMVVSMLVKHQQRMTELMRGQHTQNDDRVLAEIRELRAEMHEMKQRMGSMMLQLDSRAELSSPTPPEVPNVRERLNG